MLENVSMATQVNKGTKSIQSIGTIPEPEVRERAVRRRFTAEYKLRILKKAESCTERGQLGALLRREGLYSTNLIAWKRQLEKGTLEALSPRKRGPKGKRPDPSARRIAGYRGRCQFIQLKVCMLYGETSPIGCAWCFAPYYVSI